ncbi:DNA polymerase, partial [Bacillus pumilus]|uniref:DNA polymerase n=1 Tax=Bacillus pumilus TaxID=1408 RepID=UPI0021B1DAAE
MNSPKHLPLILFEKLPLPIINNTKTPYSTSPHLLQNLQHNHQIIPSILHYTQIPNLQSTYLEPLIKVTPNHTHKLHTTFNQPLTQTPRLT